MDDEDSGIFQSRTETSSNGGFGSFSLDETPSLSLDGSLTSGTEGSDADSPSSLSDDEGSDDSAEDSEIADDVSTIPKPDNSAKKRLSVASISQTSHDPNVGIEKLVPRMRIAHQAGERDEHWEFNDCLHSKKNTIEPIIIQAKKTSPKRILKLQLSTASKISCKSTSSDKSPGSLGSNPESECDTGSSTSEEDFVLDNPTPALHFELRDSSALQCSEWRVVFNGCNNVDISCQNILQEDLYCDALVVPGNSFGFLDGEPEIQYTRKFGWMLQEDIQKLIREKHDGELLVGQAEIVPIRKTTRDADCPGIRYAIYAPVMRVPLQVGDTVNAYLAFRAVLREVKLHNQLSCEEDTISTILCPSLCDGFGDMLPRKIALQMKTAYDAFVTGKRADILSPTDLGSMATSHVKMTTKLTNID